MSHDRPTDRALNQSSDRTAERAPERTAQHTPLPTARRTATAQRTGAPAQTAPADPWALPAPPTEAEKYGYFGRQNRWLLIVQSLSFALIGVSIVRFSLSDPRLLLFLVPFSLYAVALVVSLSSSLRRRRIDRLDHELRVFEYRPLRYPTVDVFLPTAGEDLDVLDNTYRHVAALDWPAAVTVLVLDDAAREEVRELAAEYGFVYRTRPDRGRLKKAGNLLFGYQQSSGDLIAIFDADFAPRTDYLYELVPYFEEPDVGIVQSPQYFDARRGMAWLQRCAGATQELFYRWIQPARDRSGAAICVGTCALYRRAALDKAGGFAQIGHSEDVHTGVKLMKVGYRVQYVPVVVSKGLCPTEAVPFLNQQYRWCTGSMSLLADQGFHEDPVLRPRQRLAFWAGFLYYITTAVNVVVTPLPALAMIWLLPQYVFPRNSVYLLGALALWMLVLPLTFRAHWRIDVLRIQTLYSFAHLVALFDAVSGRTKEWVATGSAGRPEAAAKKRATPLGVAVLRTAQVWIAITQVAIWAGLARGIAEHGIGRFWAMTALAALSAYVLWPILALRPEPAGGASRGAERRGLAGVVGGVARGVRGLAGTLGGTLARRTGSGDRGSVQIARPALARPTLAHARARTEPAAELRSFRLDIQGLRAIAILLVVLYHASVPGISGGYVGVDVFFVISGFLITGRLLREHERTGRISLWKFYAGRFQRLAVPAAVVVVVTLVAARIWDSVFQVRAVTTDALFAAFYAINYKFAADGVNYQHATAPPSPLQHYWSLAVEEQFYLLWPLLLLALGWLARRHLRRAAVALVVVLGGASLYAAVTLTGSDQPMAYFSLHTRAWELGIGALLAIVAPTLVRLPAPVARWTSWLGLAGIVVSGVWYTDRTPFPGTAALLPVLATAALIAAGCRPSRRSAEVLLNVRAMQGIGKVSYAWYLWHWPMLVIFPMVLGYELSWPVQVEVALISLWFAVMTYYLVESPALRSRLRKAIWIPVGAALALTTAGASAAVAASVPDLVGSGAAVTVEATDTSEITREVARGTLIQAAPSNLEPAIDRAADDQPISSTDGCHADFLSSVQGECVYGDPDGTQTMVLVGDSHAQQWLPALDAEARTEGWKLVSWTKAACPVADVDVRAPQLGNRTYTECLDWRAVTLDRITALAPDVVVMSQSDSVPGNDVTNTEWADAIARTATDLRAAGIPVIYLLDTPRPEQNGPDCVANNLDKVERCITPRENAYGFPGRHDQVASTLAAAGVPTVEPVDWFCTDRKCPAVIGNMLVYRDDSHISTPYSEYLAPATAPLFTATS